jgi:hypothetical protein
MLENKLISVKETFYMTVGSKVKQTLAALSGSEATLRMYSLQERDKEAMAAYAEAFEEISKLKIDLEKRISSIEFEEPEYKGN